MHLMGSCLLRIGIALCKVLLALNTVFVFSCRDSGLPSSSLVTVLSERTLRVQHDTSVTFNSYDTIVRAKSNGYQYGNGYLYVFNKHDQLLHFYNLEQDSAFHKVEIKQKANNGPCNAVLLLGLDSIICLHDFSISLIDIDSKLKHQVAIDTSGYVKDYYGQFFDEFQMYYSDSDASLYLQQFHIDCSIDQRTCPDRSVSVKISLDDGKIDTLPITHPEYFRETRVGMLLTVSRAFLPNGQVFSFETDPTLYWLTDTLIRISGRSEYQLSDLAYYPINKEMDPSEEMDQFRSAPQYKALLYDPYRKLLYRFFIAGQSIMNEEGQFNQPKNKRLYLMVFDEELKLITEIELDRKHHFQAAFVAPSGLYISQSVKSNESYNGRDLNFHKITFE